MVERRFKIPCVGMALASFESRTAPPGDYGVCAACECHVSRIHGALQIPGRRSLAELTTSDFVLSLMIGEATQQALLGDYFSLNNSLIVIVAIDVGLSPLKQRSRWLSRLIQGEPTIIVENGKPLYKGVFTVRDFHKLMKDEGCALQSRHREAGRDQVRYP